MNGFPSFDIVFRGEKVTRVELQVPGEHNVRNALAAAAAALALRVPVRGIREGLGAFRGAGRRFEHKGTYRGAQVYDDYAHHPEELRALLTMAQSLGYGRVICAFQPHTYSRTHELFSDFVEVLKLPDQVLLAEIFAAREQNELGISSRDLAEQIPGAEFCPGVEQVAERLGPAGPAGGPDFDRGSGRYLPSRRTAAGRTREGPGRKLKKKFGRAHHVRPCCCDAARRKAAPTSVAACAVSPSPGEGFWERSLLEEAEDRMIPTGAVGPLWGSLSISNCAVQGVSSCIGVGMEAGQRPFRTIWTV